MPTAHENSTSAKNRTTQQGSHDGNHSLSDIDIPDFCDQTEDIRKCQKELATQRPTISKYRLIDEDFTISALFPAALIARPSLSLRKYKEDNHNVLLQ